MIRLPLPRLAPLLLWPLVACDARPEGDAAARDSSATAASVPAAGRWCDRLPREANARLSPASVESDWFDVRMVDARTFAIIEARQFQEAIAYLIVGDRSALLFDSGIGVAPIRPVVERLTTLPVRVLNSHTHYDHVGGNHEFETVLAMETPYTRANQSGFAHAGLAGEVSSDAFCGGAPHGLDTSTFQTRAWTATRRIADGDTLALGGRTLEVLHVPGHTPDAVALLDRGDSVLFTGDTYYDAPVWLYVPETDLDAYERSIARLAALAPQLKRLLPAHNTAVADPARLGEMVTAIRRVRAGEVQGKDDGGGRLVFDFPHFAILTARSVLDGTARAAPGGGSGLTIPP